MRSFIFWASLHICAAVVILFVVPTFYLFLFGLLLPFITSFYKKTEELLQVLHEVMHFYYFPLLLITIGILYNFLPLMILSVGWLCHLFFERRGKVYNEY